MQCTFTADTPGFVLGLALALGAAALALVMEAGALATALRWRLAPAWWYAVALPYLGLAAWCATQSIAAWSYHSELVTPTSCAGVNCQLLDVCTPLLRAEVGALMGIGPALVLLAAGLIALWRTPTTPVRRAPRTFARQPAPPVWPLPAWLR